LSKKTFINICKNCGAKFEVDMPCKHDPTNKKKFVRCCSKKCVSELASKRLKEMHRIDCDFKRKQHSNIYFRRIDKEVLVQKFNYEHKLISEIASELKCKETTLRREMRRHNIKRIFYRKCPQCGEFFGCKNRSMVNPESNKFKKFCSRKCYLSSRKQCDTWIELEVETFLKNNNFNFKKQVPINRMTIDFVVDDNIAIEVNGDFWHANPDIYGKLKPLHKYHERVMNKDSRKKQALEQSGYKVITVWENDLKTDKDECLKRLYQELKEVS